MRAFDFVCSVPWAIRAEKLTEIATIAARETALTAEDIAALKDAARERSGVEALLAKGGRLVDNTRSVVSRDGVAVMPIIGPIFPRANLFTEFSGGSSVEMMAREFRVAMEDPSVHSVILNVDSPGGQVDGINEFADMVFAARGTKPIAAYIQSEGASAAYWIASAADEIVTDATAAIGSIGVVAVVPDPAKRARDLTFVSSNAPNKRLDPQTTAGADAIRRELDAIEDVFVDTVARNRGVSRETVYERFGAGGVEIGAAAVRTGMADRVGSMESLIEEMKRKRREMPMISMKAADAAEEQRPMSFTDSVKALFGIKAETEDDTIKELEALKAENDSLRAESQALAEQRAEEAKRAEEETQGRITAEIEQTVAKYDDRFGKAADKTFRELLRGVKAAKVEGLEASLLAFCDALPMIATGERATPATVDVERVAAENAKTYTPDELLHQAVVNALHERGIEPGTAAFAKEYGPEVAKQRAK